MEKIEFIYVDQQFIIVNKPAGIIVHGSSQIRHEPPLTEFLTEKFPEIKNVGDDPAIRPGIVHRLDKDTSGVMVVARTQKSFHDLKNLFMEREVEKKYLALVCGVVAGKGGTIDYPIGRMAKNPTLRGVVIRSFSDTTRKSAVRAARTALTFYKPIKRFGDNLTLLEVTPKTGRMHQIRVHMKSIGHPIACDKKYGGKKVCCPEGLQRMFLHASSLAFSYPEGRRWHFETDLPRDLEQAIETCEKLAKKTDQ